MKILALRGQNIASLSAPFDVDLTEGPLGDSGLFAIAGPTGAGKSTLLDAICLALFDCTPRLQERGGVAVGRADQDISHRISANDVRGLLSRGAGKGFAEVDFRGTDDLTYRARWEVRRARNKPSGRLQKQDMVLTCVDTDQRIGDKKTETLAAIQDKLGLTFEQFKRSAMLAQGDFAAFLHADDRDRADLLERVTGTRIYSDISRASYQRTMAEKAAYEELAQQAKNLGRLTPEERRELVATHAQAAAAVASAETAHAQARVNADWFVTRHTLSTRVAQASEQVEAAQRHVTSAQPRREHLGRVIAAGDLRLPLSQRDEARERLTRTRSEHADATDAHRQAEARAQSALTAEKAAQQALQTAIAQAEAAAPELARAADLDARLDVAQQSVSAARAVLTKAQDDAQAAQQRRTELEEKVGAAHQKAEASRAWIADHPHAERLASQVEGVNRALDQLHQAQQAATREAAARPELDQARSQSRQALTTAQSVAKKAVQDHAEAVHALAQARAAIAPNARDQVDANKRQLDIRREQLRDLIDAATAQAEASQRVAELTAEQIQLRQVVQEQDGVREQAESARERDNNKLEEAERALDRARRALSTDALRSQLIDGEPCGVCGSTDHPWADGSIVHALHTEAEHRVNELKAQVTRYTETLATASATRDAAAGRLTKLDQQLVEQRDALSTAASRWQQVHTEESPVPNTLPPAPGALTQAQSELAEADKALVARSDALRSLEQKRDAAQATVEAALTHRDAAKDELDSATETARTAEEALQSSERRAAQADSDAESAIAQLADALSDRPDWRAMVTKAPKTAATTLLAEATAWQQHRVIVGEAQESLAELEPALARAKTQHEGAAGQREVRKAELGVATERHTQLAEQRAGLLNGQTVKAVTTAQRARDTEARAALTQAQDAKNTADTSLAAAKATLDGLGKQLAKVAGVARTTHAAWEAALVRHDVDEPTARSLLSQPASWVDEETAALSALDRNVDTAKAVHTERLTALQEHEDKAPELDEAQATSELRAFEDALKAARSVEADHAAALRRDDTARAQGEQLDQQLEAQQAIWNDWAAISDVIGSQDGKKFRTFAQGLTLDALLVHANHHLRDLAPRYRLQRVPGEDLALQVIDQDMGDEVRPIPSLSGGETFLSSLALALGLSSLASSETPVESLFIDEGFGTLDRDTLEVALAALDALQASGRQVGLISHVDGLSEHIGVAIQVEKLGAGKSRVVVPDRLATP